MHNMHCIHANINMSSSEFLTFKDEFLPHNRIKTGGDLIRPQKSEDCIQRRQEENVKHCDRHNVVHPSGFQDQVNSSN